MAWRAGERARPVRAPSRSFLHRGAPARAPLGALALLAVMAVSGCQNLCVRHSDCPPALVCEASGLCDVPPAQPQPDAQPSDPSDPVQDLPDAAAAPDAGDGAADAGDQDAGELDPF